jgi:hypothetical protein
VSNPANQCQSCNPGSSTTAWTDKAAGASCSDGLFCTINDACDGSGNCASTARDCSDGLGCTLDVCNETLSVCTSVLNGGCVIAGVCYGGSTINPLNPCQVCDPSTSTIGWSNRAAGTSCSDGLFCTANDTCNSLGLCTGTARDCSDGLSCTTELCKRGQRPL